MIQIIAGEKGKGKTKILIERVNSAVKEAKGSIVYLDKSNKHMYELSNKIRLINVKDYCIENYSEFIGFICGLISQDHDLEAIYLDSFLKIAYSEGPNISLILEKLEHISKEFNIDFVISISLNEADFPENVKNNIVVSL
ncbi:twitching motility protein PilT [Anaerocolumna sedimenticola]|uniref:Twitching motility protein PilT n=1 Tax=Anaerocolumna sedimenticola TaxID=2696063 RepID=A0A6P1TPY1_9FIRM|nr:twitching motility protein PilT [Anaerocolumna sedimenticola]QHQ62252.1 twitching motility protein PilT [Anaerocolumna sedimenticola]